jgi:twitching motility two-component system response regulator PilG
VRKAEIRFSLARGTEQIACSLRWEKSVMRENKRMEERSRNMVKRVFLSQVNGAFGPDTPRARIMVVDDSATVRKILETCLGRQGYLVESFPDGVDALRRLAGPEGHHAVPDLVILDINLPKMDGYEVARRLKAKPHLGNTIIIMLTRRDGIIDRLKGRLAGARDYLGKPFKTEELLAVVQSYLPVTGVK